MKVPLVEVRVSWRQVETLVCSWGPTIARSRSVVGTISLPSFSGIIIAPRLTPLLRPFLPTLQASDYYDLLQLTEEMLAVREGNRTATVVTALVQHITRWDRRQGTFSSAPIRFLHLVNISFAIPSVAQVMARSLC